jgi:hypothetical protein
MLGKELNRILLNNGCFLCGYILIYDSKLTAFIGRKDLGSSDYWSLRWTISLIIKISKLNTCHN